MFIGTDRFLNCRKCGRKVEVGYYECPHCKEAYPDIRNALGWRVNYSKALDSSVPRRSLWPFATPSWLRFLNPSLIATVVIIVVVDYLFPDLLANLLKPFGQTAELWHGILYLIMSLVLVLCLLNMMKLKR